MSNYNVYVVHSKRNIKDIRNDVDNAGGCIYSGIIYKYMKNNGIKRKTETDTTIVFCTEETMLKLKETKEYKDSIVPYNWGTFPFPDEKRKEKWYFHLSGLPSSLQESDAEAILDELINKIIPKYDEQGRENYEIDLPLQSREVGNIRGYGYLKFKKNITKEQITHCKLIIHNSPIEVEGVQSFIICTWFKSKGINMEAITRTK